MLGLLLLMAVGAISDLKGQNPLQNHVFGELRYDNPAATPLAGVPVMLKSLLGNIVAADTTDSSGAYSLRGFA
ncbi:MAG: hypothetical protein ACKO55_09320, partial [Bacteroidota bacterium]